MKLLTVIEDLASGVSNQLIQTHGKGLPTYMLEQIAYRMFLCKDCLMKGSCPHCLCRAPTLFYSATKVDALKKWGPMVSEEEWILFKDSDRYKKYLDAKSKDDTA